MVVNSFSWTLIEIILFGVLVIMFSTLVTLIFRCIKAIKAFESYCQSIPYNFQLNIQKHAPITISKKLSNN